MIVVGIAVEADCCSVIVVVYATAALLFLLKLNDFGAGSIVKGVSKAEVNPFAYPALLLLSVLLLEFQLHFESSFFFSGASTFCCSAIEVIPPVGSLFLDYPRFLREGPLNSNASS